MTLIWIALAVSFFLAIFRGSLVQTWLFINSLQLIAHLPLISSKLPANAHYFLLNFMNMVRLNFDSLNSSIDEVSSKLEEYELAADEDSYFSFQLHYCGYNFSFLRNLLFTICLAILIALVWLFIAILDHI